MHPIAKLDRSHVWHPFTQMRDWLNGEPIIIMEGSGAVLRDVKGRKYLDANSSIWTNLHGHNHPKINSAIRRQLRKIAHSSALGLASEPASLLAGKLIELANRAKSDPEVALAEARVGKPFRSKTQNRRLEKVFFSDDGSTAMEVALKLAHQFSRRSGRSGRPRFLSLEGAYHGDTVGAVALGQIDLFHKAYEALLFKSDKVMAPYCYRCPFNRAKPERSDAREYRKCRWECIGKLEQKFEASKRNGNPYVALVFEPLMQGAAGMIPQPEGWLRRAGEIARGHGALLVADEVMTGFGRTGDGRAAGATDAVSRAPAGGQLLACDREGVRPDFVALAKGMTGGYLPMAATLTTSEIFDAFLGEYHEFKTFFHGHSFTGNQLGAAAALASLEILESVASIRARRRLQEALSEELKGLWTLSNIGDIRQVGLAIGIELVRNWRTRGAFDLHEQAGIRVCGAMAKRGVLTRPIGNVVVLMPPYCTTPVQARTMVAAVREAVVEVLGR